MDARIRELAQAIEVRCAANPDLAELCAAAGLSRSRLCLVFKAETGVSPVAYVRRARLRRAVELLALTRLSVKQIGFDLGFSTESSFVRSFRRTFGLPPQRYRKELSKS
jgi:transcriptional regulator GlxA family with amidase domain